MQRTNNSKPAAKRIGSLEIGDRRPIETQAYEPPDSRPGAWPLVTRSLRITNPGVHDREQVAGRTNSPLPVTKPGKGTWKPTPTWRSLFFPRPVEWRFGIWEQVVVGRAGARAATHPTVYPSVFFSVFFYSHAQEAVVKMAIILRKI